MNQKVKQTYELLAEKLDFQLDTEGGAIYGQKDGYDFVIQPQNAAHPYILTVSVTAARSGGPLTKEQCKSFKKAILL